MASGAKWNSETFSAISSKKHENKYDYSLVVYENGLTPVKIICPIHGMFEQKPKIHLEGHGCPTCGRFNGYVQEKTPISDFINKAMLVHGLKYDYSLVNYRTITDKVIIICPTHGEFEQRAHNHMVGGGCNKCAELKFSTQAFIDKSIIVHGEKYDYSNVVYINNHTKVDITCPTHGSFLQKPNGHLDGKGCNMCRKESMSFKRSSWVRRGGNRVGTFYIIRCFNDTESFYKYGITSRGLKRRYKQRVHMPYNYEIIRLVISTDLAYIFDLENRFGRFKRTDKYHPEIFFNGATHECFSNYTQTHNPDRFY